MDYEDLTPELREKARACKNAEELAALAREEGRELSDAELEALSGGRWDANSEQNMSCLRDTCGNFDCVGYTCSMATCDLECDRYTVD